MQVAWRAEAEEGGRSRALPTSWSHTSSRMVSHYALTLATRAHELFHSAGDNIEEDRRQQLKVGKSETSQRCSKPARQVPTWTRDMSETESCVMIGRSDQRSEEHKSELQS